MKSILRMTLLVVAAGCLFGAALAAFDHGEVRVESKDGRYHSVRVSTGGYVRLVRQLSDNPCRQGQNWGYDSNRIWVDDGCRAIFAFGWDSRRDDGRWDNDRRDDRWDRDDRWNNDRRDDRWDRNDDRWNNGRSGNTVRIRLESERGRRDARFILNRDVRIIRRLSETPCREGWNWGHSNSVVWVDNGCRADFEVWRR